MATLGPVTEEVNSSRPPPWLRMMGAALRVRKKQALRLTASVLSSTSSGSSSIMCSG